MIIVFVINHHTVGDASVTPSSQLHNIKMLNFTLNLGRNGQTSELNVIMSSMIFKLNLYEKREAYLFVS